MGPNPHFKRASIILEPYHAHTHAIIEDGHWWIFYSHLMVVISLKGSHVPFYEAFYLVLTHFEEDVSPWRATHPPWRRSRRSQTLDLGSHCIFWGHPRFGRSYLLIECPNFLQINAIRCRVTTWFPKCGHTRNSDKNWRSYGVFKIYCWKILTAFWPHIWVPVRTNFHPPIELINLL